MRPHENYQMCSFNWENLGFDHYEAETLCDQIQKYINEQEPFDLDISFAKDNPVNWWKYINTEPEPDVLPRIASYLFAICPNPATCERGFSTLGWLFHKRRLNLNVDKRESMCKLILYWKSNSKTELGFYGIDQKRILVLVMMRSIYVLQKLLQKMTMRNIMRSKLLLRD